jgi:hypothetical protein
MLLGFHTENLIRFWLLDSGGDVASEITARGIQKWGYRKFTTAAWPFQN